MKTLRYVLVLVIIMLLFPTSTRADMAPPVPPPGSNPLPGQEYTQVRMMAETVLIDVLPDVASSRVGEALVSANFIMQNLGSSTETMAALFPISANDGYYNYPEITDVQVKVDGNVIGTQRITIPSPEDDNYLLPWVEFDITFPPGQDVLIEITYTLKGIYEYPYVNFEYILATGAGWQGTIGSVDLIVQLPYEANKYNVLIESGWGMMSTSSGEVIQGREIRWHYDELEPAREDNLSVALVLPSAWGKVLTEQANVAQDPQDGEAWGRLGKNYKEISRLRRDIREDAGGQELFDLSVEAYENAVKLLPDDALWHAGYAELLFDRYYWEEYSSPEKPGLMRSLQELERAMELKPNDPFILELLNEVHYALPEGLSIDGDDYLFLWLTATPTFQPSSVPSSTITSSPVPTTLTPKPSITVVPTTTSSVPPSPTITVTFTAQSTQTNPQPDIGPSTPLCGTAMLIPLAALFIRKRR